MLCTSAGVTVVASVFTLLFLFAGVTVVASVFTLLFLFAGVTVAASVFTLMALSVDRFLAIRHPMTFRRLSAGRHAWKVSLVIWLTAFSIRHRQIYDVFLFVLLFIVPGCFIASSYALIGRQLWTEDEQFGRLDSKVGRIQAARVMASRIPPTRPTVAEVTATPWATSQYGSCSFCRILPIKPAVPCPP